MARHPHPKRTAAAAVAVIACMACSSAWAELRSEGDGDFATAPMYRALNTGYAFSQTTSELVPERLDYVSNVAPEVNSLEIGRMDLDGATAWYMGSSQYSGFYAARTFASMTVSNAQTDHAYYWVAGQGTTTSVTFFDPTVAQARAVFRWHVSGTSSSTGTGRADGRVDFFATTESDRNWLDLFNGGFEGTLQAFGTGSFEYTLPAAPMGTPINLFFWTSALVLLQPGDLADGSHATITADYSRTIVL